jgi:PPM family protein phosphatase
MPLARIREVCALELLDPAAAAREVRAYWARVEAETAGRRDLATFLVDHLSRKDTTMTTTTGTAGAGGNRTPLAIRYAALSDTGLVRESNQDAAYAGARLLAVADGFGPRGAGAASRAVAALRDVDPGEVPAGGLLNLLEDAVDEARRAVTAGEGSGTGRGSSSAGNSGDASRRDADGGDASRRDAADGTTLTAMYWTGSQLALVHIGDSRAYLLRDGALFQITHDHTLVQSLVDEGRLTAEEAASHPQRSLLVRALGGGTEPAAPELRLQDVLAGDRYLLCSDGLSAVVPTDAIQRVLTSGAEPDRAVRDLVALAIEAGGPDNVSCVVADVVPA